MTRLAIVADADDGALYGLDGSFVWGEARTLAPGADPVGYDVVIALGAAPPGALRWAGDCVLDGETLVHRALLPANDALAALRGRPGREIVVVGEAAAVVKDLRDRRAPVRVAPRLTVAELERAAVVVLEDIAGAFAVLAAGRLLVAPRAEPAFGLLAGIDHLAYDSPREAAAYADAIATFPAAFEPVVAMAALAAESQWASAVYGRIATLR